jgi:hypothetical protein
MMRTPLEEKYVKESNGQIEYITGKGREDVVWECSKADFLINVTNPSMVQTPSKLIDYGIAGRPVLDVTNDFSDASALKEIIRASVRLTSWITIESRMLLVGLLN